MTNLTGTGMLNFTAQYFLSGAVVWLLAVFIAGVRTGVKVGKSGQVVSENLKDKLLGRLILRPDFQAYSKTPVIIHIFMWPITTGQLFVILWSWADEITEDLARIKNTTLNEGETK